MSDVFLALSLGNTNLAIGVFEGGCLIRSERAAWTEVNRLCEGLAGLSIRAAALGSVCPSRTEQVSAAVEKACGIRPARIGEDVPVPMRVFCREPQKVGVDRLLNGLAAFERTKAAVIVVDAGTAITVDVVSTHGEFCGGAIAPGFETSARALHHATELLPEVCIRKPESAIGKDTESALCAGIYWGTIGMVQRIVQEQAAEIGETPQIICTGGGGEIIARHMEPGAEYLPNLTLEGIHLAWVHQTRGRQA